MRPSVTFSDGIKASVNEVNLKYHYLGLIEAIPGALTHHTKNHEIPEINKRISEIKSGTIKGHFCIEPVLMDEIEFWNGNVHEMFLSRCGKCIKDYDAEVELAISGEDGLYSIVLEFFLSTKELSSIPFMELLQITVDTLSFEDIKQYCTFLDWDNID